MKALSLILLLLLSACSSLSETSAEEIVPPTAPPPITEKIVEEVVESETKVPSDHFEIEGKKLTLTLGVERPYHALALQDMSGEGKISVSIDGIELYCQETSGEWRLCYLGEQNASVIEINLSEGLSAEQAKIVELQENNTLLSAYLPFNSWDPIMLENGSLDLLDEVTINVGCYWQGDSSLEVKDGLRSMLEAIRKAYPDLDIYCTINPKKGGAAAIMTDESRQLLIDNMLAFAEEEQLIGIDIDWEFPAEDQWDEFSQLIVQLSQVLHNADRRLSLAFYPETATLSSEAVKAIHKVNVMAYDQFDEKGYHSTYVGAVDAINSFLSIGFTEEQLSLGIPVYGRPVTEELSWPFYSDYAPALANGTNLLNGIYFNSPQLVQDKTLYAAYTGLQSVFLYHLGCDSSDSQNVSLREAAAFVLK